MRARGAVIHEVGGKWEVQDLEVDEPGDNEVRVKVMASGLCHSDDHFVTGDLTVDLPMVGGHEGAGIVEQVGSKVTRVKPGDHVATLFIPACGTCSYCAQGKQYICDNGAGMEHGRAMDGTARFHSVRVGNRSRIFTDSGRFAAWALSSTSSISSAKP